MTNLEYSLAKLWEVEHNNDPSLALHFNSKEKNYTFFGIYPYTKLPSWKLIKSIIDTSETLKIASVKAARNEQIHKEVVEFYRKNFWLSMSLDKVYSPLKCAEILIFIVNVGIGRKISAIKAIQRIIGVKVDGVIGNQTINALNAFPDSMFDKLWDNYEVSFYDHLVSVYPRLKWAYNGLVRRSKFI